MAFKSNNKSSGRSSSKSSSAKRGYGIHNVERRKNLKGTVNKISKKPYSELTSMDIYRLFEFGWTTEKIATNYKTTNFKIVKQLRLG
ncbi:hypothetical protein DID80_06155 [Candidatus Marinamargulisbacteria bacterium SCGC AAA071-K20]|nr:hypothetical protein DID80_06155 [Candidatus Marinamargulisbacteria bacterium SCGC AAA071-K20]